MFLHREYFTIARGRSEEFEGRVREMQGVMAEQPGFAAAYTLRFLGNDTRYVSLRIWKQREDAQAWSRHPWFQTYLRERPEGLYVWPPRIEYFEQIGATQGYGKPGFALFVQGEAMYMKARGLEEWLQQQAELSTGEPGFIEHRTFKFLGDTTRYLWTSFWSSRGAFEAALTDGELGRSLRAQPASELLSGPPSEEFYTPVDYR